MLLINNTVAEGCYGAVVGRIAVTIGVTVAVSVTCAGDGAAAVIINAGTTVMLLMVVLVGVWAIVLWLMCCRWYCYCCYCHYWRGCY